MARKWAGPKTRHKDSEPSVALVARLSCPAGAGGRPCGFASPAFTGFAVSRVDNEIFNERPMSRGRLRGSPTSFYKVISGKPQILSGRAPPFVSAYGNSCEETQCKEA